MTTHSDGYSTPVLLLVFNRPATTDLVFRAVRKVRPNQLFIAADAPRLSHPDDAERCAAVRAIVESVDWPCQVRTLYRETNLGCRAAVSSAIDWFFESVEFGVILEDDCLPSEDFFEFSEVLLKHYAHDERVMHIAGSNLNGVSPPDGASYTLSKYTPIWGWATWRRAWKHYDVNMGKLDQIKRGDALRKAFGGWRERLSRLTLYELVRQGKIDTWDYQWNFAVVANDGLSVIPAESTVENIGFGENATHTTNAHVTVGKRVKQGTLLPLRHPVSLEVSREDERNYFGTVANVFSPLSRLIVKRWLPDGLYKAIKAVVSR